VVPPALATATQLEWLGEPFVFFVNTETGRASLLYHR
jgi:Sigma 54 modulation/S30EA ribosomal protein C terminus